MLKLIFLVLVVVGLLILGFIEMDKIDHTHTL